METVYISAGISAGMLYGYICGEQMIKYIQRDGCTIETTINCVLTPFMPVLVPIVLVAYIPLYVYDKCFAKEAENESQQSNERFEGFQEQNNNIVEGN